jgi:3-oxoacyl-[acyl-carrier protein] reductase
MHDELSCSFSLESQVAVNCAGVVFYKPVMDATEAEVERLLAINLKGTYWGCAGADRALKAQCRGVILNVSSTGADSSSASRR